MKFKIGDRFELKRLPAYNPHNLSVGYKGVVVEELTWGEVQFVRDRIGIAHEVEDLRFLGGLAGKRGPDNGSVEKMEVYRAIG